MSSLSIKLAKIFVSRAKAQRLRGRARDAAAIEFFIGATATVVELQGPKGEHYSPLSFACMLLASRGYSEMERWIEADEQARASGALGEQKS